MQGRRDPIVLAGGAVLLALLVTCGISTLRWLDAPFAGFLLLENRVVASAGLGHWPAVRDGEIYQQEVVAIDGRPLADARELAAYVESLPIGTDVRYRLRRDGVESERTIATARFTARDLGQLFGSLLFCGVALCAMALAIRFLRDDPVANGTAMSLGIVGLWSLTAADLYGPYWLFRLHAASECLLVAALLQLTLVFPAPSQLLVRWPALPALGYALAGGLAVANQIYLFDPAGYGVTHRIAVTGFGVGLAGLIAKQAWSWVRPASFAARQRVKVVALGAVLALSPMLVLVISATLSGGQAPENAMAFTGILYPLSIGYAVLRSDLLEIDSFVRRSLNYVVLTGILAIGYAALLAGMDAVAGGSVRGPGFALVYSLAAVLLVIPLRDRMQSTIDRIFFRSAYDFRRLVSRTSERLASVIDRDVIAVEVGAVVEGALRPATIEFETRRVGDRELDLDAIAAPLDGVTRAALAADRSHTPIETPDGGLVVPFVLEERLVALLVLGRRLSGAFYGGDDRKLLQTLANQGAVALENALALDQLRELNQTLEQKVEQRTHQLATAVDELRSTQTQLLHQEKMASLGQLVAGIAHELNNPLNFVEGNLGHLRDYLATLIAVLEQTEQLARAGDAAAAERLAELREQHDLDFVLADISSLMAAMDEGVERATTIIRELRTFSRLDKGEASEIDLNQALDTTLNLLRGQLAGVEVVREYGELPMVECLEGQLAQVFMNLIANAADAVAGAGRITIRTSRAGTEKVAVEIEDTGVGIAEDAHAKLFEPFYTTKPVGSGTGLGLAISYGIVTRHAGRIEVKSRLGEGACFRLEVPVRFHRDGSIEPPAPPI